MGFQERLGFRLVKFAKSKAQIQLELANFKSLISSMRRRSDSLKNELQKLIHIDEGKFEKLYSPYGSKAEDFYEYDKTDIKKRLESAERNLEDILSEYQKLKELV